MCRCGHPEDAHEHYRPGFDCSRCDCTGYRAVPPWSPRAWLHLHRENVRLRAQVAEFAGIERALRLQLRIARATSRPALKERRWTTTHRSTAGSATSASTTPSRLPAPRPPSEPTRPRRGNSPHSRGSDHTPYGGTTR